MLLCPKQQGPGGNQTIKVFVNNSRSLILRRRARPSRSSVQLYGNITTKNDVQLAEQLALDDEKSRLLFLIKKQYSGYIIRWLWETVSLSHFILHIFSSGTTDADCTRSSQIQLLYNFSLTQSWFLPDSYTRYSVQMCMSGLRLQQLTSIMIRNIEIATKWKLPGSKNWRLRFYLSPAR